MINDLIPYVILHASLTIFDLIKRNLNVGLTYFFKELTIHQYLLQEEYEDTKRDN